LDILLVAPEVVDDDFLFTDKAHKVSNTVRITVSQ
jgi:hypothetical protein